MMLAVHDTVKIVQEISLISKDIFEESQEWTVIQNEIRSAVEIQEGFLAVFVIEHDAVDSSVPIIMKGTDGRALL